MCMTLFSVPLTLMYFAVGLLPPPLDDHHNQYHATVKMMSEITIKATAIATMYNLVGEAFLFPLSALLVAALLVVKLPATIGII